MGSGSSKTLEGLQGTVPTWHCRGFVSMLRVDVAFLVKSQIFNRPSGWSCRWNRRFDLYPPFEAIQCIYTDGGGPGEREHCVDPVGSNGFSFCLLPVSCGLSGPSVGVPLVSSRSPDDFSIVSPSSPGGLPSGSDSRVSNRRGRSNSRLPIAIPL